MKKTLLAQAILAALAGAPLAACATEAELMQRLDQMAAELKQMKAELAASQQKTEALEQRQNAQAAAPVVAVAGAAAEAAASTAASAPGASTVLSSYGEVNYSRPHNDASAARTDVARAVIGITHRFDERTKMVAEFEWEHAVTSATDSGEAAVEQLYVEREFGNGLRAKAGLFLIPAGLLNTNHEPTAYYGVQRNFIETAIIPSTWREAGVGLSSSMDTGLSWDLGLTTGFDLSKWDSTSEDGRASPLGSIHQEGQLAKSRHLAVHGALNWRGVPGLLLGGSVFTGNATQGQAVAQARVTLWDLHARWQPGRWDFSTVYARGSIGNTAALNAALIGNDNLIPKGFDGWYAQGAYKLWSHEDYDLSPFVRWEQFNTARSYAELGPGLTPTAGVTERVVTLGANFQVSPGIVLKADYQTFRENKDANRVNLGMGWNF